MRNLVNVIPLFLMVVICLLASWFGEILLGSGKPITVKDLRFAIVIIPLIAFLVGYISCYLTPMLLKKLAEKES